MADTADPAAAGRAHQRLTDPKDPLGRFIKYELSPTLRSDLVNRFDRRPKSGSSSSPGPKRKSSPTASTAASPHKLQPASSQRMFNIGPIGVNNVDTDSAGRTIIPIVGLSGDGMEAAKVIADHLAEDLKRAEPNAQVETLELPDAGGQLQPVIRVSNAGGARVYESLVRVENMHHLDLDAARMSQEQFDRIQSAKAWANLFAKLGNLYNPIPLTEFTNKGFGISNVSADPTALLSFIKGLKNPTKLRRNYQSIAGSAATARKINGLLSKVDTNAWQRAIDQLSDAEKAVLKQLENAQGEVLAAIRAGKYDEAYRLVKRWRTPARKLYNKIRDAYWKHPDLRKEWASTGADMRKNAPRVLLERVENGKTFYEFQTVTLEHKIRLHDNPFLSVSEKNLTKSFGYENSVLLEDIRRLERRYQTVWATDEIEKFVRTMEL